MDLLNNDVMALGEGGPGYDENDDDEDDIMSDEDISRSTQTCSPQSADDRIALEDEDDGDKDDDNENQSPNRSCSPDSLDSAYIGLNDHRRSSSMQKGICDGHHTGNLAYEDGFGNGTSSGETANGCDICKLTTSIHTGLLTAMTNSSIPGGAEKPLHYHQRSCSTNRAPESNKTAQTGLPKGSATMAQQRRRATSIFGDTTTTKDNDNYLGQKLINLLQRSLIQPVIECLACNDRDTDGTIRSTTHTQYPLTLSIIMLCMLILLTNMMLSIVNTLSANLIELLSFGKQDDLQQQQQQPPL